MKAKVNLIKVTDGLKELSYKLGEIHDEEIKELEIIRGAAKGDEVQNNVRIIESAFNDLNNIIEELIKITQK